MSASIGSAPFSSFVVPLFIDCLHFILWLFIDLLARQPSTRVFSTRVFICLLQFDPFSTSRLIITLHTVSDSCSWKVYVGIAGLSLATF